MKIYNRIVIDLNGKALEEDSFEYTGPLALCKGDPAPSEPSPAEEENIREQTKLMRIQTEQLIKQNEMLNRLPLEEYYAGQIDFAQLQTEAAKELLPLQTELAKQGIKLGELEIAALKSEMERVEQRKALEPVLTELMGYEKDEEGNYVAVEGEQAPLLTKLEERYTAALEGEAPISPQLESGIAGERKRLEEDLSRKLGPDWKTSTPGIQAISAFEKSAELLREEARQSAIGQAGSQYFAARGLLTGEKQQKISNIAGLMGATGTQVASGTPGVAGGGGTGSVNLGGAGLMGTDFSSTFAQLSGLRDYYAEGRYQKDAMAAGRKAGKTQAMMGGLMGGATAGAAAGAGYGAAGGPWGAAIGGGAGLLAGYLMS